MVDFVADPEGDLSLEEDDVLVLAVVDVQGQAITSRLDGLPDADASVAVLSLNVHHDEGAGKPESGRLATTRFHAALAATPVARCGGMFWLSAKTLAGS